jgi:hypothetical protein
MDAEQKVRRTATHSIVFGLLGIFLPMLEWPIQYLFKPWDYSLITVSIETILGFLCTITAFVLGVKSVRQGARKGTIAIVLGVVGLVVACLWALMIIGPIIGNNFWEYQLLSK